MQSKLLHEKDGLRVFALVLDTDEEVSEGLPAFARGREMEAAHFTGTGASRRAVLGFFDPADKEYKEIPVEEQVEVLTLAGNLARYDGAPRLHAHAVLGLRDGATVGGHLLEAVVRPTLEVMLTETPARLERQIDAATGLPLLRL